MAAALALIWAALVIASGMIADIAAEMVVVLNPANPAHAAATWLSLSRVVNGLGGGNEIVGGMWLLLVSLSVLRTSGEHRRFG